MRKLDRKAPPAAAPAAAPATAPAAAPTKRMPEPPRGEELDSGDVEEVISLDEGDVIEGTYWGFKVTRGAKAGQDSHLHKILCEDGVARGIWGTYQLDAMLSKVRNGQSVWICYLGKQPMPSGNEMHTFRVVRVAASNPPRVTEANDGTSDIPF